MRESEAEVSQLRADLESLSAAKVGEAGRVAEIEHAQVELAERVRRAELEADEQRIRAEGEERKLRNAEAKAASLAKELVNLKSEAAPAPAADSTLAEQLAESERERQDLQNQRQTLAGYLANARTELEELRKALKASELKEPALGLERGQPLEAHLRLSRQENARLKRETADAQAEAKQLLAAVMERQKELEREVGARKAAEQSAQIATRRVKELGVQLAMLKGTLPSNPDVTTPARPKPEGYEK